MPQSLPASSTHIPTLHARWPRLDLSLLFPRSLISTVSPSRPLRLCRWYPVGGLAVPRSSSEDIALSLAIFENEEDLLKGAYRAFPFLKKSTLPLEYGYRLKEFPDEEVKVANRNAKEQSENPLMNWFNALDNPLNDGSGWFNPLSK
jgi:hypothetical protein